MAPFDPLSKKGITKEQLAIEIILARLQCVSETGQGYKALCPAHRDRNPSLSISETPDRKVLIHCFAGCRSAEIMNAIGLNESYLFSSAYAVMKNGSKPHLYLPCAKGVNLSKNTSDSPTKYITDKIKYLKFERKSLITLANELGVPSIHLKKVGFAFNEYLRCYSVVERNDKGAIIGFLNRFDGDRKKTQTGSKRGLIFPRNIARESIHTLYITEGGSDTAAVWSKGEFAIGRPSANPPRVAIEYLKKMIKKIRPKKLIIVSDRDSDRVGLKGSRSLKVQLSQVFDIETRIALPAKGYKDIRDQVKDGAWDKGFVFIKR